MAKTQRTTHRSTAGKKLYAVRDARGRLKGIPTYERAHRADLARRLKTETAEGTKTATKGTAKKRQQRGVFHRNGPFTHFRRAM